MNNAEVIECADKIEEAIGNIRKLAIIKDSELTVYVESTLLSSLGINNNLHAEVSVHKNTDRYKTGKFFHSLDMGMYTWLNFYIDQSSKFKECIMLKPSTNITSIIISTNKHSNVVRFQEAIAIESTSRVYPMLSPLEPETQGHLFQYSLIEDDIVMNALLFQYEWRRRGGLNISVRLGADPVQTCTEIARVAKEGLDKYVNTRSQSKYS